MLRRVYTKPSEFAQHGMGNTNLLRYIPHLSCRYPTFVMLRCARHLVPLGISSYYCPIPISYIWLVFAFLNTLQIVLASKQELFPLSSYAVVPLNNSPMWEFSPM
jgi:hypothetical protein